MKRFKFRLQGVLEQRERLEREAAQSLAQARRAQAEAEVTLEELESLRLELIRGLVDLRATGGIDPHEQVMYQDYLRQVKGDIERQKPAIDALAATAERCRAALVDASQEKKAIDQLRERGRQAHADAALRREQNEIDELASTRHAYQKSIDQAA